MISTALSLTAAAALLSAASALSHDHAQHRLLQEEADSLLCSCTPQSYTFKLLLDNDCSSSTLSRDTENGISNANCQISSALTRKRKNRRQLQHQGQRRDEENELDLSHLQSQLRSTLPAVANPSTNDRQTATAAPAYISSILFIEFDASGMLSIINEDDTYLSTEGLTNGTLITYPSISQSLNTSLTLEEQLDFVPGGAGLFMFGNDEDGEVILTSRVVWEFTGDCDVVPVLEEETLGWVKFEETTPAKREFCPASPSSSPTSASVTPAPSTEPPTSQSPTTATPTISPSVKPTPSPSMEPITMAPSSSPTPKVTTGEPTSSPSNAPEESIEVGTESPTPAPVAETIAPVATTPEVTKAPSSEGGITASPTVGRPAPSTKASTIPDSKSTKAPVVTSMTETPTTESPSSTSFHGKSSKNSKLFKQSGKSSKAKDASKSKGAKLFKEKSKSIKSKASSSAKAEKEAYIFDAKGVKEQSKSIEAKASSTKSKKESYIADAKGAKVTNITVSSGKSSKNGESGTVGKAAKTKASKRFRSTDAGTVQDDTDTDGREISNRSREN